jgi:hypothetical protein
MTRSGFDLMERSIHDNHLVGYEVDCNRGNIRLHTEYRDVSAGQPFEKTDVLFQGVEAYRFDGDNFDTIIFDVIELPVEELLRDESDLFACGRDYCWPGPSNTSDEAVLAHLRDRGTRAFVLHSSYGMGGWVLARSMAMIDVSVGTG